MEVDSVKVNKLTLSNFMLFEKAEINSATNYSYHTDAVIEQVIKITQKQDLILNWYVYRENYNTKKMSNQ